MGVRRIAQRTVSSRFALRAGFGGLLLITALGGLDGLRVLRQIRREDERIRTQFLFRNHLLNDIRSGLYLSGTYVRDYLLDPDPGGADAHRTSLEDVRKEMDTALASYGNQMDANEDAHYDALRLELADYWQAIRPIVEWGPQQRRDRGYAFLRDDVFPRRAAMLAVAGRIADINEQQLNAGNQHVVELLVRFQNRLMIILFATLALGLLMAAFSTQMILRLEAKAQARFQEVSEARTQLTHLSDRLVRAQETERRALARELHDEVGQSLSAVLVELRNLSLGLTSGTPDQTQDQIEKIKGLVDSTVKVVRNMSLLLRPSMLDDLGLLPALRWQAREVSKRSSMDVSVSTEHVSDDLPDEHKTCIYRVVQEALHNCLRHSQATVVRIRVRQYARVLSLSIEDDGCGFDARHSKGLGLLGVEERVARLGGTCTVVSAPGRGASLSVTLPVPDAPEERRIRDREADSHSLSRRS